MGGSGRYSEPPMSVLVVVDLFGRGKVMEGCPIALHSVHALTPRALFTPVRYTLCYLSSLAVCLRRELVLALPFYSSRRRGAIAHIRRPPLSPHRTTPLAQTLGLDLRGHTCAASCKTVVLVPATSPLSLLVCS